GSAGEGGEPRPRGVVRAGPPRQGAIHQEPADPVAVEGEVRAVVAEEGVQVELPRLEVADPKTRRSGQLDLDLGIRVPVLHATAPVEVHGHGQRRSEGGQAAALGPPEVAEVLAGLPHVDPGDMPDLGVEWGAATRVAGTVLRGLAAGGD